MPPKKGRKLNKTKKTGPKFVANAEEMQLRDERLAAEGKLKKKGSDDEDDSVFGFDGSGSDSSDGEGGGAGRVKVFKPKGVQGLIETANPNAVRKDLATMKVGDMSEAADPTAGLTRKEREVIEEQRKKAAYMKKHAAGETAEAKVDLARLAEVKKRREDAKKKKEADEAAAKAAEEERKKAAAAAAAAGAGGGGDDEDEKLDAREIKKMKPPQLKEHLKARGLSTQGAKKDLIARLLEACK